MGWRPSRESLRRSQKINKEKWISALVAIAITATAAISLAMLSIEFFDLYGAGIFLVTPFVCGAVCVLIYNRKGDKRFGESLTVALIGGCLTLPGFLALGLAGLSVWQWLHLLSIRYSLLAAFWVSPPQIFSAGKKCQALPAYF